MIAYPSYQELPYEVSVFLRTKPQIFALLEMLVSVMMMGLNINTSQYFLLPFPVFFILTGSIIMLAASKQKVCLVKTAQAFNYINIVVLTICFRFHLVFTLIMGVIGIILIICDVLVLIFSIVIAAASCSWCCRSKSRSVAVSHVTIAVPANSVGLLNHSDPSASPRPVTSVMYVLPATYGQVPSLPPPNYGPMTPVPSAYYSPVPTAPPASYNGFPTSPPPAYDQLQTQENQIHQYMK
ncbi:uncharacterized protein LOC130438445 isoform X2 [Triplophysa dalaica]|uniref:uncharacterized protein LOC130438445 isoform X2 n=1 Tax=Triplophysa dalaica TaxID=1582913 RepID=UPI0024DFFDFC|nr:uncharacterized protein LOC130438445 isoform X2 [Triplophysa dalaica]XP_056626348.1 uncharacterized protein LOC130438445 isoform X2 [Triplophysa dalaica]XP_056626350.1 uncharacterized protein LOC130438445 isoform X2 [Triplophysa dalaica]XP_056626351.1 uncharacterized protein LOC130438445 isoform X2 [Triplophysa dalaica]